MATMPDTKFFEACLEVQNFVESQDHDSMLRRSVCVKNTASRYYSLHETLVQSLEITIEHINDEENEVSKKLSAYVAYFKPFLLLHQKTFEHKCRFC